MMTLQALNAEIALKVAIDVMKTVVINAHLIITMTKFSQNVHLAWKIAKVAIMMTLQIVFTVNRVQEVTTKSMDTVGLVEQIAPIVMRLAASNAVLHFTLTTMESV